MWLLHFLPHGHLSWHNNCLLSHHLFNFVISVKKKKPTANGNALQQCQQLYSQMKIYNPSRARPWPKITRVDKNVSAAQVARVVNRHVWRAWHCTDACRHVSKARFLLSAQVAGTPLQLLPYGARWFRCVSFLACPSMRSNQTPFVLFAVCFTAEQWEIITRRRKGLHPSH